MKRGKNVKSETRWNACKLILIIFIGALSSSTKGQPTTLVPKTNHEFGRVANLDYPPAAFPIINNGNEPLAILVVNTPPGIYKSYERDFINPGDTGFIYILPNLNRMGPFSNSIEVHTSSGSSPYKLNISGEVISIQACFPDPENMNIRQIIVNEKSTKRPIEAAKINMIHNMQNPLEGITDERGEWEGEMPIGQYSFKLTASGYKPLEREEFVPRSKPILFFEMEKTERRDRQEQPALQPIEPVADVPRQTTPTAKPGELSINQYAANNIILLVDVSLSMKSGDKLELLKTSMNNLTNVLRGIDNVALISYNTTANIILHNVTGADKQIIKEKIDALSAYGITNGVKGLEAAYMIGRKKFISDGNNQIILATDGKFTGGTSNPEIIKQRIRREADNGIILSIIGFGVDKEATGFMKEMADYGNGSYFHINKDENISNLLIEEIKSKSDRSK